MKEHSRGPSWPLVLALATALAGLGSNWLGI